MHLKKVDFARVAGQLKVALDEVAVVTRHQLDAARKSLVQNSNEGVRKMTLDEIGYTGPLPFNVATGYVSGDP